MTDLASSLAERRGSGRARRGATSPWRGTGANTGTAVTRTSERSAGQRTRHDGLHLGESPGLAHCWCLCSHCWQRAAARCVCRACPCHREAVR